MPDASFSCRLLYDRYLSVHMAFELRDDLIAKVNRTTNLGSKISKWILNNFSSEESMFRNAQAMRNLIFSFWFKATSLLECLFGSLKKDKKAALKKGRLFEVLDDVFFFLDIRLYKLVSDLQSLKSKNEFWESKPPKEHKRHDKLNHRGSVGWRWQQQVLCLAACEVQQQVGNIVISHQVISKSEKILEDVVVVHCASLEEFKWTDTAENVPPTCSCPENRNGKGVCCGIMAALATQPQFKSWFNGTWFKKELLARRHRSDCDPFPDIALRLQQKKTSAAAELVSNAVTEQPSKREAKLKPPLIPTPASIQGKVKALLDIIGSDEDLLKLVDDHVDDVSHQVKCRQADRLIIQRQMTGPACTPGVTHIRNTGGNGGKGKNAKKRPAPDCDEQQDHGKFPPANRSAIDQIDRKPKTPAPKGTGNHLPREQKTYCEYCNVWIEKHSFSQHCLAEYHEKNEVALKRCSAKCTRNNFFPIVLSTYACCSHVVRKV